ncbi:MAG: roadblock/LC7 domain-containing protein [Candidatus Helarchaeota archaeon]
MEVQDLHDKIVKILKDLEMVVPQIQCSFVCSNFGLPIAGASDKYDEVKLAAETSAILSVSERLVFDSEAGNFNDIIINAENGILIIKSASTEAVLNVKADTNVKLGLLLFEINKTAKKIEKLFDKNMELVKETNKVVVFNNE